MGLAGCSKVGCITQQSRDLARQADADSLFTPGPYMIRLYSTYMQLEKNKRLITPYQSWGWGHYPLIKSWENVPLLPPASHASVSGKHKPQVEHF